MFSWASLASYGLPCVRVSPKIAYPCQRAALSNIIALLAAFPILAFVPKKAKHVLWKGRSILLLLIMLVLVGGLAFMLMRKPERQTFSLNIYPRQASKTPISEIFVANGILRELVDLMGSKGLPFFKSQKEGIKSGPNGLFDRDGVVLIKINCQWPERGGTNTDLLKELIELLLSHPDGFAGEIVVADNGQGCGSLNWALNNAEDRSQSAEDVVVLFSNRCNISTYLWDRISTAVQEYEQGDYRDGYVLYPESDPETGVIVSYPKFMTAYGTYLSFKKGIWDHNTRTYDSERLKVINFPVLKSHSVYGVTAAIKNYMGVISQPLTDTHSLIGKGALGKVMVETRIPTLNILDAIWINPIPRGGPDTTYSEALGVSLVLASTDPVALDYWASKYILLQAAEIGGYSNRETLDPDNQSPQTGLAAPFSVYLRNSLDQLLLGGHPFTLDEDRITIYIAGR